MPGFAVGGDDLLTQLAIIALQRGGALLQRGSQRHHREVLSHLFKWQMRDREMIHLIEINRAFRAPLEPFAEKFRDARTIQGGHFRATIAIVQHA